MKRSWLTDRPIAHRGVYSNPGVPENSLAAFERAIQAGHPIELDVRLSRDGEVVVFHDDDLRRVCGRDVKVSEMDVAELSEQRLFGGATKIPTLRETFAFVAGRVPLLIEIKREKGEPPWELSVLKLLKDYGGPVALQSFNPFSVRNLRKEASAEIPVGLLSGRLQDSALTAPERLLLRYLILVPWIRPNFIAFEWQGMPEAWLRCVRRLAKVPLILWTVKSEQGWNAARSLGANAIFEGSLP